MQQDEGVESRSDGEWGMQGALEEGQTIGVECEGENAKLMCMKAREQCEKTRVGCGSNNHQAVGKKTVQDA